MDLIWDKLKTVMVLNIMSITHLHTRMKKMRIKYKLLKLEVMFAKLANKLF